MSSEFDETVFVYWAENSPEGPWADCVICHGDRNFQVPCSCGEEFLGSKCMSCVLGGYPCLDMNPYEPGCVVKTPF
jgi:hypothetical protein